MLQVASHRRPNRPQSLPKGIERAYEPSVKTLLITPFRYNHSDGQATLGRYPKLCELLSCQRKSVLTRLAFVFLPRRLRKAIFLFGVVVIPWFGTSPDCRAARPHRDYLVPVKKALGSRAVYEELWQQKLIVTPGEIARFVGLP